MDCLCINCHEPVEWDYLRNDMLWDCRTKNTNLIPTVEQCKEWDGKLNDSNVANIRDILKESGWRFGQSNSLICIISCSACGIGGSENDHLVCIVEDEGAIG